MGLKSVAITETRKRSHVRWPGLHLCPLDMNMSLGLNERWRDESEMPCDSMEPFFNCKFNFGSFMPTTCASSNSSSEAPWSKKIYKVLFVFAIFCGANVVSGENSTLLWSSNGPVELLGHFLKPNLNRFRNKRDAQSNTSLSIADIPSPSPKEKGPPKLEDLIEIAVPVNGRARIPCNVTITKGDILVLLWYKNSNATGPPIYTLDFRNEPVKHFVSDEFRGRAVAADAMIPPLLMIENVTPQDDGVFSCRADNKWSRTQSSVVKLNVIVPPREMFIIDGDDRRVYAIAGPYPEDMSVALTCIVENGNPPPKVLWYLNDTLVDESFEIRSQVEARSSDQLSSLVENQLSIEKLNREYFSSVLTCQAVNTLYSSAPATASIRLDMYLKPLGAVINPMEEALVAGKKAEVTCSSWGSRPSPKISWFLRNRELKRTRLIHSDNGNSSTSTLVLVASSDDHGSYVICRVQNPSVQSFFMEDKLLLKVLYKPKVKVDIVGDQKYAIRGSIVIIDCIIDSNPPIHSVQWYFNDLLLVPDSSFALENNSLLIRSPTSQHQGYYRCGATNQLGSGLSEPSHLRVLSEPSCRSSELPTKFEAKIDQWIAVKCSVNATPSENVTFVWTQASKLQAPEKRIFNNISSNGTQSILHYRPKSVLDFGYLYCSARNIVGSQLEPCTFTVKPVVEPPKPPRDCLLMNETGNVFSVICETWSNQNSVEVASYVLEMYEVKKGSLIRRVEERQARFKIALKHSADMQGYLLKVYARNSAGKSNYVNLTLKNGRQLKLNQEVNNSVSEDPSQVSKPYYSSYIIAFSPIMILVMIVLARAKCSFMCPKSKIEKESNVHESNQSELTKESSLLDSQSLDTVIMKQVSKSSAPDLIELGCNSLVVNYHKSHELQVEDTSTYILGEDTGYALNLILSEENIDDGKQRVFCVSTLV